MKASLAPIFIFACTFISATGQTAYPLETVIQKGHTDRITVMKFSRDGKYMITGSDDQNVKLWDINSGREIRTFKGHQEGIQDLDLNIEEGLIVSSAGSLGGSEIKVWDIYTGNSKKTVKGGEALNLFNIDAFEMAFSIQTLTIAPDGKTLLWGEDNLGVQVGLITKKRGKDKLDTDWRPHSIVFSPDGKSFAAGGIDYSHRITGRSNEIRMWSFPEMAPLKTLETPNKNIRKLLYSRDGQKLSCLNTSVIWESKPINKVGTPLTKKKYSNKVTLFDLATDKTLFETEIEGWEVKTIAYSPDGKYIAIPYSPYDTLSIVKTNVGHEVIIIYDVLKKVPIDTIATGEYKIYSMSFSPDGKLLIGNGYSINYWSTGTWDQVRTISAPSRIDDFLILPNGNIVTKKTFNNTTTFFDLDLNTLNFASHAENACQYIQPAGGTNLQARAEGNKVIAYDLHGLSKPRVLLDSVTGWKFIEQFAISKDEQWLLAIGDDSRDLFVKNLKTGTTSFLKGHRKSTISVAISADNKTAATGASDNKVILWDIQSGKVIKELLGHNNDIISLKFDPSGKLLASGSEDHNIKLWDVGKRELIETLRGHKSDVMTLDFNDDGSQLVSGSGDKMFGGKSELIIWDTKRKRKVSTLEANEGYISKVVFQNNLIYCIGNDPVLNAFDAETQTKKFSYVPIGLNDYVIFTPDNYYTSTKMKFPVVHFVKGLDLYSFENFDLRFNRPDIILERLSSDDKKLIDAYRGVYRRRLNKLNLDESVLAGDFHIPVSAITNKDEFPLVSKQQNIELKVKIEDTLYPIDRLYVWVNNVPVFGASGKSVGNDVVITEKKGAHMETSIPIKLSSGTNKIQVSCLNNKGVESYKDGFEILYTGAGTKPNLYIAAMAVSRYKDSAMDLQYASKDGKDFVRTLGLKKGMFGKIAIDTLFNEKATRDNFLALKQKLSTADVNDHVVLFMAGHGLLDETFNFNFATYDLNAQNPSINGISFDMIEELMDEVRARKKLVLIDACHSGEVDKVEIEEKTKKLLDERGVNAEIKPQTMQDIKHNVFKFYGVNNTSIELMEQLFTDMSRGSGSVVISAAAGNSYALESDEWNNGVFTYSILDGLKNLAADQNHDGSVTVTELKNFVVNRVFTLTNGLQKPTSRKENLEFDFEVWRK